MAPGRAFSSAETPDNLFIERIEPAINVQQWLRWLAVNALFYMSSRHGQLNGRSWATESRIDLRVGDWLRFRNVVRKIQLIEPHVDVCHVNARSVLHPGDEG
jgi:hypothetical protein